MTLTHLRDQLDKYSMVITLDYLNKALTDEKSVARLMGMNSNFQQVRLPVYCCNRSCCTFLWTCISPLKLISFAEQHWGTISLSMSIGKQSAFQCFPKRMHLQSQLQK